MAEPISRTQRAVLTMRGLWHEDTMPVCFLDEEFRLVYTNPAFETLAREHWHVAVPTLHGRNMLTSLPLPAPMLLSLASMKGATRSEHLARLQLGVSGSFWDVRLLPYQEEGEFAGVAMLLSDRNAEVAREQHEHAQRQRLEALLAATQEAVVWITPDSQARLENEAAARFFSAPRAGVTRPVSELLAGGVLLQPDGMPLPAGKEPFGAAVAGRGLAPSPYRLRRPPHADRMVRVGVMPVLAMPGQAAAALLTLSEWETPAPGGEAPAPEAFLNSLLEGVPAVLFFLDPDLRVQLINPYGLERLGLTAEQVLGKPLQELLALPPDQVSALQEATQASAPVHRPFLAVDDANGQRVYWDNTITPVRDREGRLQGMVVLSNDVTWRVELTQALADKVHQLAAIVGHIADGVLVATPEGDLLMANEAAQRILHLPPESDLSSLARFDVRTIDDHPIQPEAMPISRVLRGEPVSEVLLRMTDPDGHELVLATSGTPIRDDERHVLMGVIVFHDITEEYRLRQALTEKVRELEQGVSSLQELDRLKTDFLNTMSHELRTPLTNIMGYVELLEDEVVGPLADPQRDAVSRVMESARHLLTLINDLLDFTQLEAGKVAFSYGPVNLGAMVERVLPAIRLKDGRGLETEFKLDPALPRVRADYHRALQVLENLLDNAFKFTPEGGRVGITVQHDGPGQIMVEIQDSGIGIPEDALPRLFSKFYQVESGLRRERGGTGLGLAICKMLVERQGGRIGIDSQVGVGTRVWFTLPIWDEAEAAESAIAG